MRLALAILFVTPAFARAWSPDPADLVPTPEVQVRCRALVRQLGHEDYELREDARKRLTTLGRHAREALLAGATESDDPEIRSRCSRLLPRAMELDRQARVNAFLADTDGRYDHDLPGWATFRRVACSEWSFLGRTLVADRSLRKAAREVFADLIDAPANRALVGAADGSKFALGELIVARKLELYRPRDADRYTSVQDVAALTFAEGLTGTQHGPRRSVAVHTLIEGSGLESVARGDNDKARVYRALVVAWIRAQVTPRELTDAMRLAVRLGMTELAADLGARIMVAPGIVTWVARSSAIRTLATYGTRRQISVLERLDDRFSTIHTITTGAGQYPVRLCDVALGLMVALSEQKLTDYGFSDAEATATGAPPQSYTYARYYFANDAARKKAFEKWAEWRKANDK